MSLPLGAIRTALYSTLVAGYTVDGAQVLQVYRVPQGLTIAPCLIIGSLTADFTQAMGRGLDVHDVKVYAAVSADLGDTMAALDDITSGNGSMSLRQVLFGAMDLGQPGELSCAALEWADDYVSINIAGVQCLAAVATITIAANGVEMTVFHNALDGRDVPDTHPITSITGYSIGRFTHFDIVTSENCPLSDPFYAFIPPGFLLWLDTQDALSENGAYITTGAEALVRYTGFPVPVDTGGLVFSSDRIQTTIVAAITGEPSQGDICVFLHGGFDPTNPASDRILTLPPAPNSFFIASLNAMNKRVTVTVTDLPGDGSNDVIVVDRPIEGATWSLSVNASPFDGEGVALPNTSLPVTNYTVENGPEGPQLSVHFDAPLSASLIYRVIVVSNTES